MLELKILQNLKQVLTVCVTEILKKISTSKCKIGSFFFKISVTYTVKLCCLYILAVSIINCFESLYFVAN